MSFKFIGSVIFTTLLFYTGCAQNTANKQDSETGQQQEGPEFPDKNLLGNATSPYLRQHADNPVNWYKWSDQPFQKAEKEGKLSIVSIGYAACHWCHVMEHKSFSDSAVAAYMNDNFVSVKIDREQRPDVDETYMTAARMVSGSGGWPLNAITLPNGKPVVAGTYFPKKQWLNLLKRVNRAYQQNPQKLRQQARKIEQGIKRNAFIQKADTNRDFTMEDLDRYFNDHLVKNIDWNINYNGGEKGGNKFPNPSKLTFQLQYHHLTGNDKALDAVTTTLDHMLKGGIYDQIGGGFSRYATDQMWKVPHFEKMLYDNSQLVSLYSKAYKVTGHERYKAIIEESLAFIEREMTSTEGGFYSSLNADSEGEEGKYYVWTGEQIDEVLNDNADLVKDYYNIKSSGNWEHGKNVLFRKESDREFAEAHDMRVEKLRKRIKEADQKLFEARKPRTMPSKDTKILTAWNALMLSGYLDAYEAFGKEAYLDKALENARFLENNLINDDFSMNRVYKDGEANIEGFLTDYSYTINAYIHLYEVTMDKKWLEQAKNLAEYTFNHFYEDASGLFVFKNKQSEAFIANNRDMTDNTKPSGNSAMAKALVKLGHYFYKQHEGYVDMAQTMLNTASKRIDQSPGFFGNWLQVMSYYAETPLEVAVIGKDYQAKAHSLQNHYLPHSFFMGSKKQENLALLKNRYVEGQTTIYVCRKRVCKLPVTDADKALEQIEKFLKE